VLKPALAARTTTIKPIKSEEQFPSNVKFLLRKKYTRMGWVGGAVQTKKNSQAVGRKFCYLMMHPEAPLWEGITNFIIPFLQPTRVGPTFIDNTPQLDFFFILYISGLFLCRIMPLEWASDERKYETGWVPYFLIALLLLFYPNFYLYLVVPIDIRAKSFDSLSEFEAPHRTHVDGGRWRKFCIG
jgi:hypothetical protein